MRNLPWILFGVMASCAGSVGGEAARNGSRWAFTALVALVMIQRGVELGISRRNIRWALERGGVEYGALHYPWMVGIHTGFLLACPAEVWLFRRPLVPRLAVVMVLCLVAAMGCRYWVMATLKRRWSTRVICLPGEPVVLTGPYRWLRHPNYLAVVVEFVALPLVHSAWVTAVVFSLANGLILHRRIRVEEGALRIHCGLDRGLGAGHGGESQAGESRDPP